NGGIPRVIFAVAVALDRARGVAEIVAELAERLRAQFVAVAQEQSPPELAGVGNPAQQIRRDKRLARTGGQGEQGSRRCIANSIGGDFLEDGADGGVLIVAPAPFAPLVGSQQRRGGRGVERKTLGLLVSLTELVGPGKE